ncbi:class I SAM-dependent methyltransferase [Candidatus Uhrbacteria bacterium]|nr:class I SAM-dependent methyltransferase [Candidatus Uhrbacteria bacterium]
MNFTLRPSKTFLFDLVEHKLSRRGGAIGLDAAAENLKNRKWFKTHSYYGLDIDLNSLRRGIERASNNTSIYGILADLASIDSIQEGSVDVIVSTNTLYHLSEDQRLRAVSHLSRIVSPDGLLLMDLPIQLVSPSIDEVLRNNFLTIERLYFRNFISRFYEGIFERDGDLGSHPIAGTKPFRLLAWLVSRLEYLTSQRPQWNKQVLFICTDKKNQVKLPFDLSTYPMIDGRIYNLLPRIGGDQTSFSISARG